MTRFGVIGGVGVLIVAIGASLGIHRSQRDVQTVAEIRDGLLVHTESPIFLDFQQQEAWEFEHEFQFRNTTSETLNLALSNLSCGCASCEIVTACVEPDGVGIVPGFCLGDVQSEKPVRDADCL